MSSSSSLTVSKPSEGTLFRKRTTSRALPMRLKLSDPSECLDIIDDMYEIYLKQQVRI